MSTKASVTISETNISYAWGRAFLTVMEQTQRELAPMALSISGFVANRPSEDGAIRQGLDEALRRSGKCTCNESASVIFPYGSWISGNQPHVAEFATFYLEKFLPRLKARDPRNRTGTYFERMIAFSGSKRRSGELRLETKNQLQFIIGQWQRAQAGGRRPRVSALQVGCFDPVKDHTGSARSGFPCLQQVSFAYDDEGGLAVNAYYPTQYIFDRAYGNYLGLCHLGHFMAKELSLELVRVNCFIGHPDSGDIQKSKLRRLESTVRAILGDPSNPSGVANPQESASGC